METNIPKQITAGTANRIAANFSLRLRHYLTAEQMAATVAANLTEKNPSICHSHDYCDANVFMAEAFETVTGRAVNLQSEDDDYLWAEAWGIAKSNAFAR